jgi:hypothetical protein
MGHPAINALQIETGPGPYAVGPHAPNAWDHATVSLPGVPPGEHVLDIFFQQGLVRDEKPNGVGIEQVIGVAVARLEMHQKGDASCRENALAITHLQEALHWLDHRTAVREEQGVENTYAAHV